MWFATVGMNVISVFIFTVLPIVFAQVPVNDDCINATLIDPLSDLWASGDNLIGGDTTNATLDSVVYDLDCGGRITSPGVWYKFELNSTYAATASTCREGSSYDSIISIFKGDSCGNLECIGGNDNYPDLPCSHIESFLVQGLTTYYILVSGNQATGTFALTLDTTKDYFSLIDSKNGNAIDALNDFSYQGIDQSRLNIQANFRPDFAVRSVHVSFDNPPRSNCENIAPYSVFGDINGTYNGVPIPLGVHNVDAKAYSTTSCKGQHLYQLTKTFHVSACEYKFVFFDGNKKYDTALSIDTSTEWNFLPPLPCEFNIEADISCGFQPEFVKLTFTNIDTNQVITTRFERVPPYTVYNSLRGPLGNGNYSLEISVDRIQFPPLSFGVDKPCLIH